MMQLDDFYQHQKAYSAKHTINDNVARTGDGSKTNQAPVAFFDCLKLLEGGSSHRGGDEEESGGEI